MKKKFLRPTKEDIASTFLYFSLHWTHRCVWLSTVVFFVLTVNMRYTKVVLTTIQNILLRNPKNDSMFFELLHAFSRTLVVRSTQ